MEIKEKEKKKIYARIVCQDESLKRCMICAKKIKQNQVSYTHVCDCSKPVHHKCLFTAIQDVVNTSKLKNKATDTKIKGCSFNGRNRNAKISYTYRENINCPTCKKAFDFQPGLSRNASWMCLSTLIGITQAIVLAFLLLVFCTRQYGEVILTGNGFIWFFMCVALIQTALTLIILSPEFLKGYKKCSWELVLFHN